MCCLEAEREEDRETECFKLRWKTTFALINGSGGLSVEGSRLDISGGRKH